jgi:hypothetical protein
MAVVLVDTIKGAGSQWYLPEVMDKSKWLRDNLDEDSYRVWWSNLKSDDMHIKFNNREDMTAYILRWNITQAWQWI